MTPSNPDPDSDPTADRGSEITNPAELRCSDVDRERVSEALREAAADGRLTLTELEERLDKTYGARTYGDLQPITSDLPQGPYPIPSSPAAQAPAWSAASAPNFSAPSAGPAGVTSDKITNVLSTTKRDGRWEVGARIDVTNMLGETTLDFTEAIVRSPEVEMHVGVVLGSLDIIVPEGIDVRIETTNILSESKIKLKEPVTPGAPVYRIQGFNVLGEVTVRPPKKSVQRKLRGSNDVAARTRRNASFVDIGIGVGVLMAIVAAIVWFTSADQPDEARLPDPVEYEPALANAREGYPYPVLAPEPLPEGWRVTNVVMDADNPAGHRWRLGMFTDNADFVGLEQSDGEIASYRDSRLEEFNADGSVTLGGDQWERMQEDEGDHALVRETDGVLTIVRGTVNYDDLEDIVGILG